MWKRTTVSAAPLSDTSSCRGCSSSSSSSSSSASFFLPGVHLSDPTTPRKMASRSLATLAVGLILHDRVDEGLAQQSWRNQRYNQAGSTLHELSVAQLRDPWQEVRLDQLHSDGRCCSLPPAARLEIESADLGSLGTSSNHSADSCLTQRLSAT